MSYEIRKIVVGPDYKNGMHFTVGQGVLRDQVNRDSFTNTIERIEQTPESYKVWIVSNDGREEVRLWKKFENTPVSVEYGIDY